TFKVQYDPVRDMLVDRDGDVYHAICAEAVEALVGNAKLTENNKQLGFVQNSDRIASVSSRVEGGSLFREPTPGLGKLFFASVLDDRRALDPIRLTRNELHCQFLSRQSHSANRRLDCPS
ncbi:MAG: hypothetical protein ACO3FE_17800, partial [Planctomycetaceae bacterium]